jgi:class 3 adenylate cyclase
MLIMENKGSSSRFGVISKLFGQKGERPEKLHYDPSRSPKLGQTILVARPALRKAYTEQDLYSDRGKRAISPKTRLRMEKALGICQGSAVSAPTQLNVPKKITSASSLPPIPTECGLPTAVDKAISKRLSLELAPQRRVQRSQSLRWNGHSNGYTSTDRRRVDFDVSRRISASISPSRTREQIKYGADQSIGLSETPTQLVSSRKSNTVKANVKIPKGKISIVITDIQGSTMMWEQDSSAMKDALDLHDSIVRKCYTKQSGYEITTEGDSFHLAFHHPLDALSFCLDCQTKLYNADWSEDILALDNAKLDKERAMRGLRVRMGIHHGVTTSDLHKVTQRIYFKGEGVELAKALEKAAHGGQIITNIETWRAVSGMAERYLGSPQILDLGVHEVQAKGDVVYTNRLVQLVPRRFAFDYFSFRGTKVGKQSDRREGRTFPPPQSYRQISTAFFDAPYLENRVTMVFVHTVPAEDLDEETFSEHSDKLAKMIRKLLIRTNPPGYECQEDNGIWMLAFHSVGSAILFGINLIDKLEIAESPLLAKVGVHSGEFASMGPHTVTGRADYFGPVVNRAARIAGNSETRQVRLGIPKTELRTFDPPNIKSIKVEYLGTEVFKGVNVEMALFACVPVSQRRGPVEASNVTAKKQSQRGLSVVHDTASTFS